MKNKAGEWINQTTNDNLKEVVKAVMPQSDWIELRSDTYTQPTEKMWASLQARPALGDDISQEDLTVAKLEQRAAEVLGKDSAVLVISGTMANQIAVMTLTNRGEEIIVSQDSHIYNLEVAALATLSQVQVRLLKCNDGYFSPAAIREKIRDRGIQSPRTSLICLENTHDLNQGIPVTLENMREIGDISRDRGIPLYVDGARIFNAATALEVNVRDLVADADLVQICLTKGLGAPLGSILAGSREIISRARWMKQRIGGGMRQAGIIAAPGLVSLSDERIAALKEDHRRARILWREMKNIDHFDVYPKRGLTNIVTIKLDDSLDPGSFNTLLGKRGVRIKCLGGSAFRMVLHHQVSDEDLAIAVRSIKAAVQVCSK